MKTANRFNEITKKLNKMYKGSEENKDKVVSGLKSWLRSNRNSDDKVKIDCIKSFLSDNNIF